MLMRVFIGFARDPQGLFPSIASTLATRSNDAVGALQMIHYSHRHCCVTWIANLSHTYQKISSWAFETSESCVLVWQADLWTRKDISYTFLNHHRGSHNQYDLILGH